MTEKRIVIKTLSELNESMTFSIDDIEKSVDLLIEMTSVLGKSVKEIEWWKKYFETLLVKFSFNAKTLMNSLKGLKVKESNLIDIGSCGLLIRSLLENYLTLYYLYFEPKNNSISEFRFLVYKLSGLKHRNDFKATNKTSIINKKNNSKEIEKLKEQIKNHIIFEIINDNKKQKILGNKKHHVRMGNSWNDLMKKADFNINFISMWSLFSNYAHSEFLSIDQISYYYKNYDQKIEFYRLNIARVLMMLISRTIVDFCDSFDCVKFKFEEFEKELKLKINFYFLSSFEISPPNKQ